MTISPYRCGASIGKYFFGGAVDTPPASGRFVNTVTYPFAKLTLDDNHIKLDVLGSSSTNRYEDINKVYIDSVGIIHIHFEDKDRTINVFVQNANKLFNDLLKRDVKKDKLNFDNMRLAQILGKIVPLILIAALVLFLFLIYKKLI